VSCLEQPALEEFARAHELEFIALFGSRARSQEGPASDWDLALMPRAWQPEPAGLSAALCERLARGDLDVVWLPQAPWLLAWQVGRDGRPLYERQPGAFHQYALAAGLRRALSRVWQQRDQAFVQRCLDRRWEVDTELVNRHLGMLARYLHELEQVLQTPSEQLINDFRIHRVAERQLELLVECAGTINTEVSQALAGIPSSDYYSSFFSLAQAGWIDRDTAVALARLASLRNRLVHHYLELDLGELDGALRDSIPSWRAYLEQVLARLKPL
jgi:uncharacterized protein YutE (UPF0331/DUF86 family)